jgi:hypothetical protein
MRAKSKSVTKPDDFQKNAIRGTVHNRYDGGEMPTEKKSLKMKIYFWLIKNGI